MSHLDRLRAYQAASPDERVAMIREHYAEQDAQRAAQRAAVEASGFVSTARSRLGEGVQSALRYWNVGW